jgi:hypothetical protein
MLNLTDPATVERAMRLMTADERAEFESILAADPAIWRPQVGRQMDALKSTADIIGYGGAAGGGKSDLIAGLALTQHQRTLILRREKTQTEGIIQRLTEILGLSDGYNSQKSQWKVGNRLIEFGGLDNPNDHQKWQGRAHDLKALDEVTEMREHQARFVMGWNRSADPEQRKRCLLTFNPPTTVEGRWVIAYFAPWLDEKHPNPAKAGELRWFTTLNGKDIEVEGSGPFVIFKGEPLYDFDPSDFGAEKVIRPKSRTFIPSRVTDNYFYMKSGYIDTLQSMPEPLRSQMLDGDFKAGVEDDPWQVIPTAWIDAAMDRWTDRKDKGVMASLGADIAAGGKDNMVIARRFDLPGTERARWFDDLIRIPGRDIPQERAGPIAAGHIMMARTHRAPVHIDVVGWGLSATNFLQENHIQVVPVNGAALSLERTLPASGDLSANAGALQFYNKRAEIVWRMREALNPLNPVPTYLPDDTKLRSDLAAYKWKFTSRGIQIESKDEMKKRLGRSPDDGDAVCLANMTTLKTETLIELEMMQADEQQDRYSEFL